MDQSPPESTTRQDPATTPAKKPHTRVINGLLRPAEKVAVAWLCARMPRPITSDMLTVFGLFGAFLAFVSYALSAWHPGFLFLASLGIFFNWFGDALDGTLARFRKTERPRYGYFIDHTVDIYNELFMILGLGLTAFIRFEVACLAFIVYLMMSVFVFVRVHVVNEMRLSVGPVGPTEMRAILILLNGYMFFAAPAPLLTLWAPLTIIDLVMLVGAVATMVGIAIAILVEARRLGLEDPPKRY